MKKGISLIVLVITVIVLAILATVVITNIKREGLVEKTRETVFSADWTTFNNEFEAKVANEQILDMSFNRESINAQYGGAGNSNINRWIPSFDEKYASDIVIINGNLIYIGDNEDYIAIAGSEASAVSYVFLDYIESSGTQYIDTGFVPDQNSKMYLDFEPIVSQSKMFAGTRYGNASTNAFTINSGSNNSKQYGAMGDSGNVNLGAFDLGRHEVEISKTVFTYDGSSTSVSIGDFTATTTVYLFACNDNNKASLPSAVKIYECKLWDDGVLVLDLVPCIRLEDNDTGMYDLVSNTFYQSEGMGTFKRGTIIERELEGD